MFSQPSASTVASVGIGIPLTVLVIWLLKTYLAVDMPPEVQGALGALLSTATGYFFSGGKNVDLAPPTI